MECLKKSSEQHSSISPLELPEILVQILNFIEPKELPKCRLVCKFWNELAFQGIIARLKFTFSSHTEIDQFLKFGQTFFGFHYLKLEFKDKFPNRQQNEEIGEFKRLILQEFLPIHGKPLRRFEMNLPDKFTLQEFRDILATCSKLVHLELTNVPCNFIHGTHFEDGILLKNLTTIYIELSECVHNDETDFAHFLRLVPNLKNLHVSNTFMGDTHPNSAFGSLRLVQALLELKPPHFKELYYNSCRSSTELLAKQLANTKMYIKRLIIPEFKGYSLDFESNLHGNVFRIKDWASEHSGNSAGIALEKKIMRKLETCDKGVSSTVLLKTFMEAHASGVVIIAEH